MNKTPEQIRETAAGWFVRLNDPAHSEDDRQQFEAWLAASDVHQSEYQRLQRLWVGLGQVPLQRPAGNKRRRLASGLLGLVVAGGLLVYEMHFSWNHYSTAVGERQYHVLDDGSILELGTHTTLKMRDRGQERTMVLASGQVFIDVAREATHKLVVTTPQGEVRDIGTRFEVRSDQHQTQVGVMEGWVEVRPQANPATVKLLSEAQQLRFDGHGTAQVEYYDAQQALAWRDGNWIFRDTPLQDVVHELNRYHARTTRVAPNVPADIRVSGVFHTHDREALLAALAFKYRLLSVETESATELRPFKTK